MNKKILFVAMAESVHTSRWISQVSDQGWDLYLFPVNRAAPHPGLSNLTLFGCHPWRPAILDRSVHYKPWTSYFFYRNFIESRLKRPTTRYKETGLAKAIQRTRPDIIHSLEFQHSAYLTMGAKKLFFTPFPKWIATNWGSDILLFGRLAEHKSKIQEVLSNCDYYSAECQRDVELARNLGFNGQLLPVLPNGGGYDLQHAFSLRQPGLTSERKVIALKGYQTWAGRALVGLAALRMCADQLSGYEIVVYSTGEDVRIAAEILGQDTGIPITTLPPTSHDEILKLHGRARISIGLSISDAISTSLLEALVMGSFPIQSGTACADEWITSGRTGFIVPPEDPREIADAIRRALSNDGLVNSAAEINSETARQRLDYFRIKSQVIQMYESIFHSQLG